MKNLLAGILLPGTLAILGVVALVSWASMGPMVPLDKRLPGQDRPKIAEGQPQARRLVGKLTVNKGDSPIFVASMPQKSGQSPTEELPGSWPRFRGTKFDGIAEPEVPLARKWPAKGPVALWTIELGEGHAGAAVWQSRVFVMDYDRAAGADALRCFALADGKELWRFSYPVAVKRNHGMSRTTPAVSDKYLVTLGPKCHVSCLDPATGKPYWDHVIDLVREFGATEPPWYAGQCPLIDGERAILATGGPSLLIALDCATGEVAWKSPNPRGWVMTHASIMPMEFAGRRMYVYCGKGGVAGVSADDGSILWDTNEWKIGIATVPSPTILPEGKIFFCGGYNSGAMMMQLEEHEGRIVPKTLYKLGPAVFGSTQHTPIFYEGHLYGVREKDKQLVCLDPADGRVVWSSGNRHRFGLGGYMIAGGLIYVMNDEARLTMAEASPGGYKQRAEAQILDGHDSWGPMAMAGSRLIVRDVTRMVCLDVKE